MEKRDVAGKGRGERNGHYLRRYSTGDKGDVQVQRSTPKEEGENSMP